MHSFLQKAFQGTWFTQCNQIVWTTLPNKNDGIACLLVQRQLAQLSIIKHILYIGLYSRGFYFRYCSRVEDLAILRNLRKLTVNKSRRLTRSLLKRGVTGSRIHKIVNKPNMVNFANVCRRENFQIYSTFILMVRLLARSGGSKTNEK